jgi:DNA-binding IclR family transcriptional regulator
VTGRGPGGTGPGRDAKDAPRDALRDSPLRRLLLLLESFGPQHDELTLTELSKRSGLPLTTTHRMIGELTAAGVLERTAAGRYHVGLRLWETAALAPRALGMRETAFPFLEDLFLATRENVVLAVRDGDEMVFVERLSAPRAIPVLSFLGRRRSLHASSAGLVLLAYAEPELQEHVFAGPLRRYTSRTLVDSTALRAELDRIRRCGHAISEGTCRCRRCPSPHRSGTRPTPSPRPSLSYSPGAAPTHAASCRRWWPRPAESPVPSVPRAPSAAASSVGGAGRWRPSDRGCCARTLP